MMTGKVMLLCFQLVLSILTVSLAPSALGDRQNISAPYNNEKNAVLYLPDLSENGAVWVCDRWDADIVLVKVEQIQTGRTSSGTKAGPVAKITVTGMTPGFSCVIPELYDGERLLWRDVLFVEIDEDLNAVIRYAGLEKGSGGTVHSQ